MKRTLASHLQQGQHHHIQSSSSTSAASSSQFQNPLDSELTNPQLFAEDVDERDFILSQDFFWYHPGKNNPRGLTGSGVAAVEGESSSEVGSSREPKRCAGEKESSWAVFFKNLLNLSHTVMASNLSISSKGIQRSHYLNQLL
ncbi:hypothetical protein OIU78_000008 [Salix suchowensis]|nr:hypothetical protein OIU78_000008 [Salix suchowensis]